MNKQEIQQLADTIKQRRLVGRVKTLARLQRPTLSADTIARAWEAEDFETAPDAVKLVLRIAQNVKTADDKRMDEARQQMELTGMAYVLLEV